MTASVSRSERFLQLLAPFDPKDSAPGEPPTIAPERHVELAEALRSAGYTLFGFCVATHYPSSGADRVKVVYGLRSLGKGTDLAVWQLDVALDTPVPSLAGLFAGADWQEREQWDLVGVRFQHHPDLRRLMLPEDWNGHPLQKNYAIDTKVPPWR